MTYSMSFKLWIVGEWGSSEILHVNFVYFSLFNSARELELEDRQGRLQQQLRDSMSLEG